METIDAGGLAGSASLLTGTPGGGAPTQYASPIPQDRLIRQEVSLGVVRELIPPTNHIGLSLIAPFMEVPTDDVVFQYVLGQADGLAPARAMDAESEMYQSDDVFGTEGRASVMDWALKNHYTASDVNSYRDWLSLQAQLRDTQVLPLTAKSAIAGFDDKLAKDTAKRRRRLDNRLELLIMSPLQAGVLAYNDGKIKFNVDYGRPAQQNLTPAATMTDPTSQAAPVTMGASGWMKSDGTGDPINDILAIQTYAYDKYGIHLERAICSRRILSGMAKSNKFTARAGLITNTSSTPVDLNYLIEGWSPSAAQLIIEGATGVKFIEYDAVYRTRNVGSTTTTNNRFLPQNMVVFLPSEADIEQFDDTDIGFAKMLTSPHPAGNWQPGFYDWEKDCGQDPWGYDIGTGIKAFPVFLHMETTFTYTLDITGVN